MPAVSIIIPLFNKSKYIGETLSGILSQSFKDYEIIVVDDGSTDNGLQIVQEIAKNDERVKVYSTENQGVSCARNYGLTLAMGKWVWFIDADDKPDNDWLTSIEPIVNNETYDIVFGDYYKCFPDGSTERISALLREGTDLLDLFFLSQFTTGYYGYLWNKLIRRDYINKCNAVFEPGLTLAEDLKFMISLYRNDPLFTYEPNIVMNYIVDAENSSRGKKIDYMAQLRIQYDIYTWAKDKKCNYGLTLMQKRISDYVSYVFFYAFEEYKDIEREITWIKGQGELLNILSPDEVTNPIMKKIAEYVKRNQFKKLKLYLTIRFYIRRVFRSIKKRG